MKRAFVPSLDYDGLKTLAARLHRPVSTLIALAPNNDPFYVTPARLSKAHWFADLWNDVLAGRGVHVRRLHYRLISQDPPVLNSDGAPYENTKECWDDLIDASRDARLIGLVPADHFVDRRNDEPLVHLDHAMACDCSVEVLAQNPYVPKSMPAPPALTFEFAPPIVAQRYQVELWCEKTTINDILEPLASRFHCNVITGSGELSLTACINVVERVLASERPTRILYISDFDPGGQSMPVAVARKIEHQIHARDLREKLDIQVRPVALTYQQCEEYGLPRTPIKETERRAGRFEERFGQGATELDALEALHPGILEEILIEEIERYHDATLDDRVDEMAERIEADLSAEVSSINERVLDRHDADIECLRTEWHKIERAIRTWERHAKPVWQAIANDLEAESPSIPFDVDWPEPEYGDDDDDPLFDSTRDYVEQIDRYKTHQGKPTKRRGEAA